MSTIGDRISHYIEVTDGMNNARFAEIVGIAQAYVSQIRAGVRTPSERVIADICEKLGINYQWLKYGEGTMIEELDENQRLTVFLTQVLNDEPEAFRKKFILSVSEWDEKDWLWLKRLIDTLSDR